MNQHQQIIFLVLDFRQSKQKENRNFLFLCFCKSAIHPNNKNVFGSTIPPSRSPISINHINNLVPILVEFVPQFKAILNETTNKSPLWIVCYDKHKNQKINLHEPKALIPIVAQIDQTIDEQTINHSCTSTMKSVIALL
jgi:hypothetical protein